MYMYTYVLYNGTYCLHNYGDSDIDECADNSTCDYIEGSQCVNTPGGYDCVCPDGYVSCEDACIRKGI